LTIAAGFLTGDAVVLCADSQETIGDYAKTTRQKIYTCNFNNAWRIGIVGASDDATYVDLCQEELERRLCGFQISDFQGILNEIKSVIYEVHSQHIWPRQRDDRPSVQLLIAIHGINQSLRALFVSRNSTVLPVHESQTIGVGTYLADYLLSRIYPVGSIYNATTEEIARTAIFVLDEVKSSIQGCDDETLLMIFQGDGRHRVMTAREVNEISASFDVLYGVTVPVFRAIASPSTDDEEFQRRIRAFENAVAALRLRQRGG
jgi:hypothetical protein